jgi:hypothetical protein
MTAAKPTRRFLRRLSGAIALIVVVVVCWRIKSRLGEASTQATYDTRTQTIASLPSRRPSPATQNIRNTSWRAELAMLQGQEAVAWLIARLNSGEDAPTGESFVPGGNGQLTQTPSWRVAWLEELGRRDPAAAAAQAEKILAVPTTAEEWAAALRWLAQGRPEARALLEEKTRTLLQYEPWRHNPTVAWLEAFDVAVYVGGTSLLPELTELAREQDNGPAAHAAFLALDRLVQKDTASVLAVLLENPDLLTGREAMRGNLFAWADVDDVAQRRLLEDYLLAPNRSPAELEAFVDVFPNANFHLSANLLTRSQPPDPTKQRVCDIAALAIVREWRDDIRFIRMNWQLARIQARLEEFVSAR